MGWNDRLPEDPHIPYENQDDQESYENWQMYLEHCRQEHELTSQNLDPAHIARFRHTSMVDLCRDLLTKLLRAKHGSQKIQEEKQTSKKNTDSR